jgi:thiamine kinase-like enzyme
MGTYKHSQHSAETQLLKQIDRYLKNLPPEVLELQTNQSVEILELFHGAYNLNYHVKVNGRDFLFRINIEQQSGLADQIDYEFRAMRFLSRHGIAPKCYHLDNTRQHFEFGILIEEYLHGPYVSLVPEEMPEIAELLVRLHTLKTVDFNSTIWRDPFPDNYKMVCRDLMEYEAKKTPNKKIIKLTRQFLGKIGPTLPEHRALYVPDGINHTDLAIDNFIHTPEGLRLIDWEKPRLDDCSYDVCCFLCEPCQLWCTTETLSQEGHEVFLEAYIRMSKRNPELFRNKVKIRKPLVSMHWILWGANRLCDSRDNLMAVQLQDVQEVKIPRWERIADPTNIEKLLETN